MYITQVKERLYFVFVHTKYPHMVCEYNTKAPKCNCESVNKCGAVGVVCGVGVQYNQPCMFPLIYLCTNLFWL